MECNKEEASRAKVIAEKKLQGKDYLGARKFLLKAQQLYPEIENISQLLSVCDVHCSAENKMFGNDMDWYGILQVSQTADELLIKKQYRKFALLLHPDKNKFPGAEAAFKLIGEAQRILLDKEKRSLHDMRRRTPYKPVISHKPPQSRSQNKFPSNPISRVNASNPPHQGKTQHAQPAYGKETLWTRCLHCSFEYQFYKELLGKMLFCLSCKKPFHSYDIHAFRSGTTQPVFPQQGVPNATTNNVGQAKNENPTFDQKARQPKGSNKMDRQSDKKSKLQKPNSRRGKKHVESSESSDSDGSLDSEEAEILKTSDPTKSQHFDSDGYPQTRKSNRNRRHVSYNEKVSDDEHVETPSKKAKGYASTEEEVDASKVFGTNIEEETKQKECNMDHEVETLPGSTNESFEVDDGLDSSFEPTPKSTPTPEYFEYPDPEFFDFDKSREENCFKVGELWAVYDTVDAMPRFYAKIKKIYASGFKLRITWLEADPDDELGIEWLKSGLSVPCGKFRIGSTEITEDRLMFSHLVSGFKSTGKNSFMIYPTKGDIWAIYKNWDAKWHLIPETDWRFEYETVEVLCGNDDAIRVVLLDPVEGFTSVYKQRTNSDSLVTRDIPHVEFLRFSHQIPSFKLTNERDGCLKGCFELDLASFPSK